jgi:hypothetical protein
MVSGAGNRAGHGIAGDSGRNLADQALLDELLWAERSDPEIRLGPGNDPDHRQGGAASLEEVIIAGGHRQPQLSTDVHHPLLDRRLAVLVARLTHLLAHRELEAMDGAVDEAVVVEFIFASDQDIAEPLEAG